MPIGIKGCSVKSMFEHLLCQLTGWQTALTLLGTWMLLQIIFTQALTQDAHLNSTEAQTLAIKATQDLVSVLQWCKIVLSILSSTATSAEDSAAEVDAVRVYLSYLLLDMQVSVACRAGYHMWSKHGNHSYGFRDDADSCLGPQPCNNTRIQGHKHSLHFEEACDKE